MNVCSHKLISPTKTWSYPESASWKCCVELWDNVGKRETKKGEGIFFRGVTMFVKHRGTGRDEFMHGFMTFDMQTDTKVKRRVPSQLGRQFKNVYCSTLFMIRKSDTEYVFPVSVCLRNIATLSGIIEPSILFSGPDLANLKSTE